MLAVDQDAGLFETAVGRPARDRETREPLVPFNASGEALSPMAKLMKAALERGLYLMTHWNVIMVCPPLTITREELDEGLGVLDEVLSAKN